LARGRFLLLAKYAEDNGAAGILFTCSAFGEAIEAAARKARIPVLKPNEAMFEAALAAGKRLGMLATFEPSIAGMEAEFRDIAGAAGSAATLDSHCAAGAMKALQGGDGATHDRLLAEAAPRFADYDAVLLAHFSTSRAETAVRATLPCPVLTAPGAAVERLKGLIA
jgi:Asp/Glu/hydantoin racemase